MSPEQCRGETLNHLSDVYSLGIVLWEMFAGKMPFTGSTVSAMIKHQLHTEAPPLRTVRPDAPVNLEQLIMSCMAKDQRQRPPSTNAVYQSLREVLVTQW
jgi:serine/threonine-protein kinase